MPEISKNNIGYDQVSQIDRICGQWEKQLLTSVHCIPYTEIVQGSEVRGSRFRVKNKEGIKDPKSSIKILILPNNCQFGSKFWIRPDEGDAFFVNTHALCSPGMRMEP